MFYFKFIQVSPELCDPTNQTCLTELLDYCEMVGMVDSSLYKIYGPYEFTLTKGHNKISYDECYSWPLIPKGSLALVSQVLVDSGQIATGVSNNTDYSVIFQQTNGNTVMIIKPLKDFFPNQEVIFLQLIMFEIPGYYNYEIYGMFL